MGTTTSSKSLNEIMPNEDINFTNEAINIINEEINIPNEEINIPNDQYTCPECNLVPEILKIDFVNGSIDLKCQNHGEQKTDIKEYFKGVTKHSYYNLQCNNDKAKQSENINEIFEYCVKCKQNLCQSCSKNHEHESSFIKVNELNSKCPSHLKDYEKYCISCKTHFCNNEEINCDHEIENIIPQTNEKINTLKNKKNELIKNKEIIENIIKLLDVVMTTYEKHPSNYFNCINISNIAENIIKEENNQEESSLEESIKEEEKQEDKLLTKVNQLQTKVFNYLNEKLGTNITGNEVKLELSEKGIKNEDLILLSAIEFKNLEEINLGNNDISNIKVIKEFKSPKLKIIDLSFNKINDITPLEDIIKNNEKLENINFSHNEVKKININDFKENVLYKRVKDINLEHNKIIEKDFDELRKIIGYVIKYELDSSNSRIRIFGEKFIQNNKDTFKLVINDEEKEMCQYYYNDKQENGILYIKLFIDKELKDLGFMVAHHYYLYLIFLNGIHQM